MARSGAMGTAPVVLVLTSAVLLCYALLSFLALPRQLNLQPGCRMAYMRPSYVSHNAALRMHSRSSSPVMHKYSLLEYREGGVKHGTGRHSAMPALFIPGNAGSYGQVRSLASSGANQYYRSNVPASGPGRDDPNEEWKDARGPIDWYTLDFNEDFSAFHGQTLHDQAFFVNEAIHYLRSLYPGQDDQMLRGEEKNVTVALVGHSMGGIVARLTQHLPNYVPRSVDTIVTLSTPHAYPPVPFDRSVERVYNIVNSKWTLPEEEPLLLSIAGGVLDTQLSSDASSLSLADIQAPVARLSTFTTSLAMLWSSVDHLAVVWCDQLRYKIARGLLLDYWFFGKESEHRAEPLVRIERREMWRKLLGMSNDAASPGERHMEAQVAQQGPMRLRDLSPPMGRDTEGKEGVLMHQPGAELHAVFTSPGPRATHDWHVQPDETLSFELLTNLCVGTSANRGAPVKQEIELVTQVCFRSILPSNPTQLKKAYCQVMLPNAYETLPASPPPHDPSIDSGPFPNASLLYEVPSTSIKRLHLSADYLRENHVTFIRLERSLNAAMYSGDHTLHRQTLLTSGWVDEEAIPLRGVPWLGRRTWELPGTDVTKLLSFFTPDGHGPRWQWFWPDVDSSLVAYDLELEPAPCALRFNYTMAPRTAPMLRVTNRATNDARIYPSLDVSSTVRMPVALHGSAPFMPRAPRPQRGTLLELWVPDDFRGTVFTSTYGRSCPLPYGRVQLRVNWRNSAALLVLRYRFALLIWPVAVLAAAHALFFTGAHPMPIDALCALTTRRTFGMLLGAPLLLQVVARVAEALHLPGLWYAAGIGTTDARFALLGPMLMLIAYGMTLIVALLTELSLHLAYVGLARFIPRRVSSWAASSAPAETSLPSRTEMMQWATQRRTLLSAALLVSCWVLLPYQVLILACFLVHCTTLLSSYIACQEAENQPRSIEEWEARVAPHETQQVRTIRALQTRYAQHSWLHLFLVWMLPLHLPALVVWVRNVNIGVRMGLSRTQHSIAASLAVLAIVYLYANAKVYERPQNERYTRVTRGMYLALFLASLVYGIRFAYIQYEVFQVVLAWEVAHRLYALHTRPAPVPATQEEREIFVLEPMHLALPRALQEAGSVPNQQEHVSTSSTLTPMDDTERRALQMELEQTLESYLATLEAYMDARTRTASALAAGFVQLSRAKFVLGGAFGQRVSQDAYDARMKASVRWANGRLQRTDPSTAPALLMEPVDAKDDRSAGLRRRTINSGVTSQTAEDDAEKSQDSPAPHGFDALYQFSGLPPPALRASQQHFRDALVMLLDGQAVKNHGTGEHAVLPLQHRLEALEARIIEYRKALRT
ncbi:GPI inositol deacylase [Malassezia brasiliensis]|uniref:GPI inositol-deacylase n=1 Tax=Malassezia brasiliensis TaxID=1821822 RepID=A0AAF0DT53_9BASI|nr:GPI inositol deacylase [Malassezia brasiliensis]